jgi:hypothetical protein
MMELLTDMHLTQEITDVGQEARKLGFFFFFFIEKILGLGKETVTHKWAI